MFKEVKMMSLVLSGSHHGSGGSWRQQGLQGHLQLVKALGHHQFCDGGVLGPPGFQFLLGGKGNRRTS